MARTVGLGAVALAVGVLVTGCGDPGMDAATEACRIYDEPGSPNTTSLREASKVRNAAAEAAREDQRWDYLYLWADRWYRNERKVDSLTRSAADDSGEVERLLTEGLDILENIARECGKTDHPVDP